MVANIITRPPNTVTRRLLPNQNFIVRSISQSVTKKQLPFLFNAHLTIPRLQAFHAVAEEKSAEPETSTDTQHPQEIRRCLVSLGWDNAWIDGILQQMQKGRIQTTVEKCRAAVEYLESVGLAKYIVQNMVSINHRIVSKEVETELKPIVEYIKKRGMSEPAKILYLHPQLFDFTVMAEGTALSKGERGRAQVDVFDGEKFLVHFWRTGAAFQTAPVAPYQPKQQ